MMTDNALDQLLDEAIAARRSAVALSARQQRELLVIQSFDAAFATELADAYAAATPDERTRKLHAKRFEQFRDWVRPDQVSALPAAGATVASYLIHLRVGRHAIAPDQRATRLQYAWFHDAHGHYLDCCLYSGGVRSHREAEFG